MSRTTQHGARQQTAKAVPETRISVPLQMAMALAEGRNRLQIKQIEAIHAALSENSRYCKSVFGKMADSSGLLAQWAALCQHKAQHYSDFTYACIEIMAQSAADINRLLSASLSAIGTSLQRQGGLHPEPSVERRSASKIIAFPERRIATASVLMQAHRGNSGGQHAARKTNAG